MTKPIYQAGRFEPCALPGEFIMLLGADGPYGPEPFYEVQFTEGVKGLGQRGLTLIWTQANAAPAGYGPLPSGIASGSIAAGAQSAASAPSTLSMGVRQLLQFRWNIHPLALTGPVLQDIDVLVNLPAAVARNGTLSTQGRFNMIDQFPLPGDQNAVPAQGASYTVPTMPYQHPADVSNLTELFVFENTFTPSFTVANNGSATLSAGSIGIFVWGWRMDLIPVKQPYPKDWIGVRKFGKDLMVPPRDYAIVPISGRGAATSGTV